jgi:uncharacterized protein YjbI with pentapeptide repeats
MNFKPYHVGTALLLLCFFLVVSCDNNNSSNGQTRALSEKDFANDPDLKASVGDLSLYLLESSSSPESTKKTGELGFDILPISTKTGGDHTFCWEDIVNDSEHLAVIFDQDGAELVRENVNGNCQTIFLEPGDYEVQLFNDNKSEDVLPVFIQYRRDDEMLAKHSPSQSFLDKVLRTISFIDGSSESHAQTTQDSNFLIFVTTWSSPGCDLSGVDFSGIFYGADLSLIDLAGADLTGATMANVTMWNALITNVSAEGITMGPAAFNESFFSSSDFSNATITNVDFFGVTLRGVRFTNSFMQSNDFNFADLSPDDEGIATSFDSTDLSGSSFVNAFDVKEATFTGASMQNVDMSNLDLAAAGLFTGANLDGANLSGVSMSGVAMLEVSFQNANFTNADLSNFICVDCDFTGADFTGANTDGVGGIE